MTLLFGGLLPGFFFNVSYLFFECKSLDLINIALVKNRILECRLQLGIVIGAVHIMFKGIDSSQKTSSSQFHVLVIDLIPKLQKSGSLALRIRQFVVVQ